MIVASGILVVENYFSSNKVTSSFTRNPRLLKLYWKEIKFVEMDPTKESIENILKSTHHYDTLGLKIELHSAETVKKQYRKLAKLIHPDKILLPDLKKKATEAFRKLTEASNILQNTKFSNDYFRQTKSKTMIFGFCQQSICLVR